MTACNSGGGYTNIPPVASFIATPGNGVAPLVVNVNASASSDIDGQIAGYSWNFGDGQTASGITASHTYSNPGSYTITLTATDNNGASTSVSQIIEVNVNIPPVASFIATPGNGVAPLVVNVNASASSDGDGQIAGYSWNFGDGQTASGITASHTYSNPGSYTITLTVTDNNGASSSASDIIDVIANMVPVASFIATPGNGVAPLVVNVNASASSDSDGQILSYSWSFGDGQTGNGVTADHTFNNPGSYTITLTVTDNSGASGSVSQIIEVVATISLSGTVNSAAGSIADSDVNDPNASYQPNDSPAQAQPISNPVVVGGYSNVAGEGAAGRSSTTGDRSDFYRVSMSANQSITLNIADFNAGDLDLYLYFDDGSVNVIDSSIGTGQTETLTISQSGNYVIEVYAYSGYSNYALVVGQAAASITADRLVSTDDFVPGDVIVRFKENTLMPSSIQAPSVTASGLGLKHKAGADHRAMLLGLDSQSRLATFSALGIASSQMGAQAKTFRSADPQKQLKMDTLQVIKALRKRNDVLYAEPNYIRQARQVPGDSYYRLQWHYPLINLPSAWDVSTGDPAVVVAVIDTGVLLAHPDLQGQLTSDGYDFIRSDTISQDGEPGIDANPDDPGDSTIGSSSFHGTHVAGTIAAATSFASSGTGVAGVAPGVKVMPLRVLGNGGGTAYDINQAIRYAAGLTNDSGKVPTSKADVINLSLGGGSYSQSEQDVYTLARNAGVIVVAAAGNESSSRSSYPAAYNGVISVSAVDINKKLAPYSNYGSTVDVAAPGGDSSKDINGDGYGDGVLSTAGDDSSGSIDYVYKFFQGTSMASPHMAGVVALMKSVYSGLTPAGVDSALSSGQITQDLGTAGRDDLFGYGMIDARKAVDFATGLVSAPPPDTPLLGVSPASLNFGVSETSAFLSVINGGSGSLSITSVSDDALWLSVSSAAVDGSGLGSYQVTVDRSSLAAGIYTASITVISVSDAGADTVTVPVILQVVDQNLSVDVGYQYILLIDADTDAVIQQWEGNAVDGNYSFAFNDVPFSSGQSVHIIAGTDQNNDGFICDAGESCGAYISLDQPIAITATGNHNGLDFISGYSIGLRSLSVSDIPKNGIAIRRQRSKQVLMK